MTIGLSWCRWPRPHGAHIGVWLIGKIQDESMHYAMLKRLQQAVIDNGNVFEVLIEAVRVCSLGQITNALFEVGGQYRRNM
jgi:methylmalonyl-CoA mutase N-terminal domain/subunit